MKETSSNPRRCAAMLTANVDLYVCVFAGITMYAVGVGKAVEDELREIASEPVEKHFYYTTDFTAISTIAENLKLNVCPGKTLSHHMMGAYLLLFCFIFEILTS